MEMLAGVGALAALSDSAPPRCAVEGRTRRTARRPVAREVPETLPASPLDRMTTEERLSADYHGTGLTVGRHPMHFRRAEMNALGVSTRADLNRVRDGGTGARRGLRHRAPASRNGEGIVFLSMEDETGIFNVIVMPDMFDSCRLTLVTHPYLLIEGKVQNVENVIHVLARRVERIESAPPAMSSHDFK